MASTFPSFNEYQDALQNPKVCFQHYELKSCGIEADLWGLPRVRSGGFALTYKLIGKRNQTWAVRCFHKPVPDRTSRYLAISRYLSDNKSDFFIPVRYLPKGIVVRGNWYPITYMKWVEGDTLEACLVKNVGNSRLISKLSQEFQRVVAELERLRISHGDLSHRNIIVRNGKIVLIDYDGMFVPNLRGRRSSEIGKIHFQHPARTEVQFGPEIDRFSEIVIYLALEALASNPDLWKRFETGGEGLLFKGEDFRQPYQSPLLQEIETLSGLRSRVGQFRRICNSQFEFIPTLRDFVAEKPAEYLRNEAEIHSTPSASQHPVYLASQRFAFLRNLGKVVTVVGKITEVFHGTTKDGHPHVFLNFGNWRAKCFTIVLWSQALQLLKISEMSPNDYQKRWVSVTGVLTAYNRRPQIAVESPTDVEILHEDQATARLEAAQSPGRLTGAIKSALKPYSSSPGRHEKFRRSSIVTKKRPVTSTWSAGRALRPIRVTGSLDHTKEILDQLEKLYTEPPPQKEVSAEQKREVELGQPTLEFTPSASGSAVQPHPEQQAQIAQSGAIQTAATTPTEAVTRAAHSIPAFHILVTQTLSLRLKVEIITIRKLLSDLFRE